METIYSLVYGVVAIILMAVYIIGILYMVIFRIGYTMKRRDEKGSDAIVATKERVSVVLPIYNEETRMIRGTIDTLRKQRSISMDVIIVIKHPLTGQINMLKGYRKYFHSLEIIEQRGKPSHNEAFIIGLRHASAPYSAILCADAKIKDNSLSQMVAALKHTKKDVAFGSLYPEVKWTNAGRSTGIAKIVRQDLTLFGRYSLGLGYFIPGAFAVYRTSFLKNEFKYLTANNFVMHDLGITLRLSRSDPSRAYFMNKVVGTELEKATIKGWLMQNTRWFMGTTALFGIYGKILAGAKLRIRIGVIGTIILWDILPFALFAGVFLSIIGAAMGSFTFVYAYISAYIIITLFVLSLPDARTYGLGACLYNWILVSIMKSISAFAIVYGFAFAKYNNSKLYVLFKR